jgi:hypothetical protein
VESSHPQHFVTLSNVGEVGEATVNIEYKDGSETRGRAESCILPAQRSMSERAGSTLEEATGSHSIYLS